DRKSTRLNSSHVKNSYAVFCLKKKSLLTVLTKQKQTCKKNKENSNLPKIWRRLCKHFISIKKSGVFQTFLYATFGLNRYKFYFEFNLKRHRVFCFRRQ